MFFCISVNSFAFQKNNSPIKSFGNNSKKQYKENKDLKTNRRPVENTQEKQIQASSNFLTREKKEENTAFSNENLQEEGLVIDVDSANNHPKGSFALNHITSKVVEVSGLCSNFYSIKEESKVSLKDFFGRKEEDLKEEEALLEGKDSTDINDEPEICFASGVVINDAGLFITSYRPFQFTDRIFVKTSDGKEFLAKIIAFDSKYDIAAMQIDSKGEKFEYADFGSIDDLLVGDGVLSFSNPFNIGTSLYSGIVSSKKSDFNLFKHGTLIETDFIGKGNSSGSVIFDNSGNLVGLSVKDILPKKIRDLNINLFISSDGIKFVLDKIFKDKRDGFSDDNIQKPCLGFALLNVDDSTASMFNLEKGNGAYVDSVAIDGSAYIAGILAGDIILKFDGIDLKKSTFNEVIESVKGKKKNVELSILRDSKVFNLHMDISSCFLKNDTSDAKIHGMPKDLIETYDLTPDISSNFGLSDKIKGAVVAISPSAIGFGVIKKDDVIIYVNGEEITGSKKLNEVINEAKKLDESEVNIDIIRYGSYISITTSL